MTVSPPCVIRHLFLEMSVLRNVGLCAHLRRALRHTVKSEIRGPRDALYLEIDPQTKTRGFQLLTVDHLPIDGNLVLNRSDPYIRARLPRLLGKHSRSVCADVIRVASFCCFVRRIQGARKVHYRHYGEPSLHSAAKTVLVVHSPSSGRPSIPTKEFRSFLRNCLASASSPYNRASTLVLWYLLRRVLPLPSMCIQGGSQGLRSRSLRQFPWRNLLQVWNPHLLLERSTAIHCDKSGARHPPKQL